MQLSTAFVFMAVVGCGAQPAHVVVAPPQRLADVAMGACSGELRALGYRVGAVVNSGDADGVVASRDAKDWYLLLAVETSRVDDGPKLQVRLSVFGEPGRQVRGEVAPFAIAPGATLDADARRALARMLGKRAADQFAENFGAADP